MRLLHDLRVNCLLMPLALAVLSAGAITWVGLAQAADSERAHREQMAMAIGAWAVLRGAGMDIDPARWIGADPRWRAAAVVRIRDDRAEILTATGRPRLAADAPPPGLIQSVEGPECWGSGPGQISAAAVIRDAGGLVRGFVYGEAEVPPAAWGWLFWTWGAALGLGGLFGWYLMRHVWKPWEDMRAAINALEHGRTVDVPLSSSEETAALQSSVIMLVERSRSAMTPVSGPGGAAEAEGSRS